MLRLHRRRQQQIRVVGGVGREILDHHGEEVLAGEAAAHLRLVRHGGHRVARVDQQRLHRRVLHLQEPLAQACHAQPARAGRPQVVAPEPGPVGAHEAAHVVDRAAAGVLPVAGDARDAGDGAHRHAAAGVALQAHRHADAGRARGRQALAERDDALAWQPGDRAHALRGELENPAAERLPAGRVRLDERAVLLAERDDDVEQAEGQGGVGAGMNRQMLVGRRGRPRADRIDDDHPGAVAARRLDVFPQVVVRGERVRTPQQNQLRGAERLRVHPDAVVAQRVAGAVGPGDRADRHHVL